MSIDDVNTQMAWVGILAYSFQIYFDFSGYSDMAIGIGRMLGFTFPENFKDFKVLIKKENLSRINCINLPFDAVLKVLK